MYNVCYLISLHMHIQSFIKNFLTTYTCLQSYMIIYNIYTMYVTSCQMIYNVYTMHLDKYTIQKIIKLGEENTCKSNISTL